MLECSSNASVPLALNLWYLGKRLWPLECSARRGSEFLVWFVRLAAWLVDGTGVPTSSVVARQAPLHMPPSEDGSTQRRHTKPKKKISQVDRRRAPVYKLAHTGTHGENPLGRATRPTLLTTPTTPHTNHPNHPTQQTQPHQPTLSHLLTQHPAPQALNVDQALKSLWEPCGLGSAERELTIRLSQRPPTSKATKKL